MSYQGTLSSAAPLRQSPPDRAAGLAGAMVTRLAERGRALFAAWRGRQALSSVAGMTPAELRDIGLLPGDLQQARHLPYGADPTEILARIAADRAGSGRLA